MEKLNRLALLAAVMVIFVAGCGKKDKKGAGDHKKVASNAIPTLKEETENLFDDRDVSELAFVDDELTEGKSKSTALASNGLEVDRSEIAAQDADHAAAYAFKVVQFSFNKNDIRADQRGVVGEDVELARNVVKDGKDVIVEGHTCQIGSAGYNLALSQRRAESVKEAMVSNGVPAESIKTIGLGYERPLVWSDARDRQAMIKELSPNRRAELLVQ